jgi:hypothetical protein
MALLEVVLFGINEFVLLTLLEVSLDRDRVRTWVVQDWAFKVESF